MKEAHIPIAWRDSCASILIDLNECRDKHFHLPNKCTKLMHAYEKCQHEEYEFCFDVIVVMNDGRRNMKINMQSRSNTWLIECVSLQHVTNHLSSRVFTNEGQRNKHISIEYLKRPQQRKEKEVSEAGNRTPVVRVTGGNT